MISFVDGSTMKVNIVESNSPPLREGVRIRQISEDRVKLVIECQDGSVFDATIVDPGSSVVCGTKTIRSSISDKVRLVFLRSTVITPDDYPHALAVA